MCDIYPDIIAGTSAGAIVGALYSYYKDAETAFIHLLNFIKSDDYKKFSRKYFTTKSSSNFYKLSSFIKKSFLLTKVLIKNYIIDFEEALDIYRKLFNNIFYKDLKIKFFSCATDFIKGKPKLFNSGDLALNILASCAIPGIFPMIKIADSYYVDGFVSADIPITIMKKLVLMNSSNYYILASDLSSPILVKDLDKVDSFFDVILRTIDIAIQNKSLVDRAQADFVFNPILQDYEWDEFENYKDFVRLGFESFKKSLYYFYRSIIYKIEENINFKVKDPFFKLFLHKRLKKIIRER